MAYACQLLPGSRAPHSLPPLLTNCQPATPEPKIIVGIVRQSCTAYRTAQLTITSPPYTMASTSFMRALPRAFAVRTAAPRAFRLAAAAPARRSVAAFSSSTRALQKDSADASAETGSHGHEESFEEFSARYGITNPYLQLSMAATAS